jgi:hypothetical protein
MVAPTLKVADGGPRVTSAQSPPEVTALQRCVSDALAMNNKRAPSVAGLISGTRQRKVTALLRVDDANVGGDMCLRPRLHGQMDECSRRKKE